MISRSVGMTIGCCWKIRFYFMPLGNQWGNHLSRFIHQLLNPNYFPIFYECANPPFPVLTFCPRFLIKSPFYESFLMETQRENGRNIDFLMTGHIPPIEVFRPLVRITISP